MSTPQQIREEADAVLKSDFGVAPERSTLHLYDTPSWTTFKKERKTQENHGSTVVGLYTIADAKAHVWSTHPHWISTLYHELHGHGLYYEQSVIGKHATRTHSAYDDRLSDAIAQWGFPGTYKENSEGFAVWMESYLCDKTGRNTLWRLVLGSTTKEYRAAYERTHDLASDVGPHGLLCQMGIPIPIDTQRSSAIVRASAKGRQVDLALALPKTNAGPLRALIVSDARPPATTRPWFAPRVITGEEFIAKTKNKDHALARELRDSTYLFGDRYAWETAKKRLIPS